MPATTWYLFVNLYFLYFYCHHLCVCVLAFVFLISTTCDSALITPKSCTWEHSEPVMVALVANKFWPFAATILTSLFTAIAEWPPTTPGRPPPSVKPPPGLLGGAGAGRVVKPLVPLTQALRHSSWVSNLFAFPRHPPKRKGWHSRVA